MLKVIHESREIAAAQMRLRQTLEATLPSHGRHNIGFPGGNEDHIVFAAGAGELYCAFSPPRKEAPIPRYWNSFGIFRPEASAQEIVVEINIPRVGDDGRVAGFFAKNPATGDIYLMHDGGIGGGRAGIGKAAFLDSVSDRLVEAEGPRRPRYAMMIANLNDPGLPALIWRFVLQVDQFKRSNVNGAANGPPIAAKNYKPEFSGRKRGTRPGEFDYVTYHGVVVDELRRERTQKLTNGERVDRDQLVDLFVERAGHRVEIYEVKTSCDRQSLYTGIGQLLTHGRKLPVIRTLVLPKAGGIPSDCAEALAALGIETRRFTLRTDGLDVRAVLTPA